MESDLDLGCGRVEAEALSHYECWSALPLGIISCFG